MHRFSRDGFNFQFITVTETEYLAHQNPSSAAAQFERSTKFGQRLCVGRMSISSQQATLPPIPPTCLPTGRPVEATFDDYRRRFGIESSYSRMHQARARTASRKPGLRALLVGVAFVLTNLWAYLKWACVSLPRPVCRQAGVEDARSSLSASLLSTCLR